MIHIFGASRSEAGPAGQMKIMSVELRVFRDGLIRIDPV